MSIEELFNYVPVWVRTAVAMLLIQGLIFWRVFKSYLKVNKAVGKLKEDSYEEMIKVHEKLLADYTELRLKYAELLKNNTNGD